MEFQEVVRRRRMVRSFSERPVPRDALRRILANANRAPSAGFTQGWAFLVLEGAEEKDRFWRAVLPEGRRAGFRWPGVWRAPVMLVMLSDKDAYLDRYAEPDKGWADRDERRWPVPYWDVDTAFAAMLALLTAVDAELGALFFRVHDHDAFREAFGVPERLRPLGAIAIGYPEPDRASSSLERGRRPLPEVVHRGRWGSPWREDE